ncbi:MAG: VOC family protein [Bacillota bacterium]|nr:VOC family protein [Bacillota bacterium]
MQDREGSETKFKNTLLAVTDMEKSVEFYKKVLGLRITADFGANVTLTGGLSLQTYETWAEFLDRSPEELGWAGKVGEIYFEEEDFDAFAEKLKDFDIVYVHPVKEHRWGQRAVRFYDPDSHIIEVAESLKAVVFRFLDSGMTPEQVAERMDVELKFVNACIRRGI